MTVALCQCIRCERYLARNRAADGTDPQLCVHCTEIENRGMFDDLKIPPGIPLARIRGTLQDPIAIEVLALLVEECGEVAQRVGKINRWGWEADFEGRRSDTSSRSSSATSSRTWCSPTSTGSSASTKS